MPLRGASIRITAAGAATAAIMHQAGDVPTSSKALLPRCRFKLGNLFQSDGEQFGGLIAGAAGLGL
jgi:hypothetical protein